MSGLYDSLKNRVDRGKAGLNAGIPMRSLSRLDQYTTGIQQGDYWLIGAETNVGKTKFARNQFIYEPYQYYLEHKDEMDIFFIDISLEMTKEDNLADLIAADIYNDYGKIVDKSILLSRGYTEKGAKKIINDNIYELFLSYEEKYKEFDKHIYVHDEDITPTKFHNILFEYAKKNGTFENPDAPNISRAGKYTPNNPNLFTIITFDTINLADTEDRQLLKQSIDRISRVAVWFRKVCNFTPVIIQQFNAEISGTDRSRYGIKTPLLRDFEDSKRTTKDATIVLGLFDPTRHKMEVMNGYDIKLMKNCFRSAHLLKNRNGEMNKELGMQFKGAVGTFQQLPRSKEMQEDPELYEKYNKY